MKLYRPIPTFEKTDGWKKENIIENNEKLVPLSTFKEFIVESQYYKQKINGSINECYVRKEVANRLLKASSLLPKGYKLVIWDTWRPVDVQQSLFDMFKKELGRENPDKNEKEIQALTEKYVSLPSTNLLKPSPHITGGSVDLSIIDENGKLLNMGTDFDDFSNKSKTRYFEELDKWTKSELEALHNRRLLYNIMTTEGFTNYYEEWWHFDFGNQFWAKVSGKQAKYSYIEPV